MTKNHKNFLSALMTALAICAILGLALPRISHAAPPMAKTMAPAYYRMMVGEFEVTALSDGTVSLPVDELLTNTTREKVKITLAKSFLSTPLETSVNAYLVNTGSKLILIDAGAGKLYGPTLGGLIANLNSAGYQAEQIDEIYVTHLHPDHVGGLVDGERKIFTNAVVHADKRDADFWLVNKNMEKVSAEGKDNFKHAIAAVSPYVKTGHFITFSGDVDLVPGIKAIATPGHSIGHSVYAIESKGSKLVILGDLIHVAAVQFPNPAVTVKFDSDSRAAAAQRQRIFLDAAKNGYMVAAAHVSFPGIGHLRENGKSYVWLPINYSVIR